MKGLIIYKGKYGATRQYAGWLSQALHLPAVQPDEVTKEQLLASDFLLIGSSVYIEKFQIRDWLKKNSAAIIDKKLFLFIVCGTPADEKEKLEGFIRNNVPVEIRSKCEIYFLPGRMIYKNLTWSDKLLLRVGAMFTQDARQKQAMLNDFDGVKKQNLSPLLQAFSKFISVPLEADQHTF
jgi:menaquinone-dependent protoporphyrinogen IX oxidase